MLARLVVHLKKYDYFEYVKKSLLRLLVPWAIFTLLYTFARYAFEVTDFLKEKLVVGHSLQQIIISAYGSVYAPQLYFLFSLFLIRLCSPVFKRILLIKNNTILLLVYIFYYVVYKVSISILPIAAYLNIDGGQEPVLHALGGVQFYFLGVVIYKISEVTDLKRFFLPFLVFFIFVLLMRFSLDLDRLLILLQYVYLLTIFFLFTYFQNRLPLVNLIGKNTMGIYLIHAPIILKCVSLILNKIIVDPLLSFTLILFSTFFLSFCIVFVINSIPYGSLLFGTSYKQTDHLSAN